MSLSSSALKTFTVYAHVGLCWKIRVVLYRSRAAMRRARRRLGKTRQHHAIEGFCWELPADKSERHGVLAEIHLYKDCTRGTVVHESAHAALHAASVLRIDLNHNWGNETMAQMIEQIGIIPLTNPKMLWGFPPWWEFPLGFLRNSESHCEDRAALVVCENHEMGNGCVMHIDSYTPLYALFERNSRSQYGVNKSKVSGPWCIRSRVRKEHMHHSGGKIGFEFGLVQINSPLNGAGLKNLKAEPLVFFRPDNSVPEWVMLLQKLVSRVGSFNEVWSCNDGLRLTRFILFLSKQNWRKNSALKYGYESQYQPNSLSLRENLKNQVGQCKFNRN